MSSGDFDPRLLELYPEGSTPEQVHHTLVRQASQHERTLGTIKQHYQLLKAQGVTLERVDQNLKAFIQQIEMERAEKKLTEARGEYSLKRMTAILGFAGAIIGALATATVTYLTRDSQIPDTKPAPAEQLKRLEKLNSIGRNEPAPSKEFNQLVDDAGAH